MHQVEYYFLLFQVRRTVPNFCPPSNGGGSKQKDWQVDVRGSKELEKSNTGSNPENLMELLWLYVDINALWIVHIRGFAHRGPHSHHPHLISPHTCHLGLLDAEETWYERVRVMGWWQLWTLLSTPIIWTGWASLALFVHDKAWRARILTLNYRYDQLWALSGSPWLMMLDKRTGIQVLSQVWQMTPTGVPCQGDWF